MSALPPKADIRERVLDVRFGPKADILRCGKERRYSITSSARERDEFSAVSSAALFGPLSRYQEHCIKRAASRAF
jgi:hypothetical protein